MHSLVRLFWCCAVDWWLYFPLSVQKASLPFHSLVSLFIARSSFSSLGTLLLETLHTQVWKIYWSCASEFMNWLSCLCDHYLYGVLVWYCVWLLSIFVFSDIYHICQFGRHVFVGKYLEVSCAVDLYISRGSNSCICCWVQLVWIVFCHAALEPYFSAVWFLLAPDGYQEILGANLFSEEADDTSRAKIFQS